MRARADIVCALPLLAHKMSALAGIFTFDRAPIDSVWLASAGAALSNLGPDGGSETIAGPVGMAYRAFHTTPESRREHQPSIRAGVGLLTWDGRLDNRDELRECLGGRLRHDDTDVEHVWAAYERWGTAAFGRLIGDFALALWDARVRTLWLARDAIGTRMLYYAAHTNRVLWSSDIALLVSTLGDPAIDEDFVAAHLLDVPEFERTPYTAIRSCAPGTLCQFAEGCVRVDRFWKPEDTRAIRYPDDESYDEHFRIALGEAVRSRLRANRPVYVQLSGGLDSSSVVCIAHDLVSRGGASAPGLKTLSYVSDTNDTNSDARFIATIEQHLGRPGHHINHDDDWLDMKAMAPVCAFWPNRASLVAARDRRVQNTVLADDARVILSGFGGDHLLWPYADVPPHLADLVVQKELVALHTATREWARARRVSYLSMLWAGAVQPFWRGFQRISSTSHLARQSWLSPQVVDRAHAIAGQTALPLSGEMPSFIARLQNFRMALSSVAPVKRFTAEPSELVYPFLDRRVVELCLGMPFDQILRPGQGRVVQRRALRGILPERIRKRVTKGGSGSGVGRGLAREWSSVQALFADAAVFRFGWVRAREHLHSLSLAKAGLTEHYGAVIRVLPLELWLSVRDIGWRFTTEVQPHQSREVYACER